MRSTRRFASHSKEFLLLVLTLILVTGVSPRAAFAQGEVSLWGSVTDSSGASVAGAAVTVLNLETGSSRALVTDEAGRFNATALSVGHYEVTASKAGFQSDRRTNIALVVGQREEIDLTLQVGDVHQTVEVPSNLGSDLPFDGRELADRAARRAAGG